MSSSENDLRRALHHGEDDGGVDPRRIVIAGERRRARRRSRIGTGVAVGALVAVAVTVAEPAATEAARVVKAWDALDPGAIPVNDFEPQEDAMVIAAGTFASFRAETVTTTLPATQRLVAVTVVGTVAAEARTIERR